MAHKLKLEKIQDKIKNTINELLDNMQHSGSVIVATDKEIIYKKCFCCVDFSKKIPISTGTQFLVGSVRRGLWGSPVFFFIYFL